MDSARAKRTGDSNAPLKPLSVRLVLKERGWILEKIANRLAENLPRWDVAAEISRYPSAAADLNHWMIYYDLEGTFLSRTTVAITHVDRPAKLHVLKERLEQAELGICMSRMTMDQLAGAGVPRLKLCYILPGHDGDIAPNRIVIGLTTQIRSDGAKREDILIRTAKTMRLDAFHFSIIGPHWEKIIGILEASGATVDYAPGGGDNETHRKMVLSRLSTFHYYLYMGWDEGSMGLLDALAAGVPTIVTPQGFHLDINGGITYPIVDDLDLRQVFQKLSEERQRRIDSVKELTWERYAQEHAMVWRALMKDQGSDLNALLHATDLIPPVSADASRVPFAASNIRAYFRSGWRSLISDLLLLVRSHLRASHGAPGSISFAGQRRGRRVNKN